MNQNNSYDTPQLGYFLDYNRHWVEALRLLKYQLETKEKNKHFNTLEMFYYEKLEESFEELKSEVKWTHCPGQNDGKISKIVESKRI